MDLRDRLRMLRAAGTAQRSTLTEPMAAEPLTPFPLARPDSGVPATIGDVLDGIVIRNEAGETFYIESRYPLDFCRGALPLSHLFGIPSSAWQLLHPAGGSIDLRQAVFFDTETTGLAGGSGTYAFLVGIGFFQADEFVVRQYFLRDYPEEEAMLEALTADLQGCSMLVTFNGRSFDWPLMETRFRMSRRRPPLAGVPHLDLLHPARRVWKERLLHCNLTNLETEILGVKRHDDVPGHLIPPLYFDYLRGGSAEPLAHIVLHNRLDIVSLVSLMARMGHMLHDPLSPTADGELLCGDDLYGLGRLLEQRGLCAEAIACYETALQRGLLCVPPSRVQRELAFVHKRLRQHGAAVAVWTEMIQGKAAVTILPFIELAKYYEHVTREHDRARELVVGALSIVDRRRSLGSDTGRERAELLHRLQRLDRKLGS